MDQTKEQKRVEKAIKGEETKRRRLGCCRCPAKKMLKIKSTSYNLHVFFAHIGTLYIPVRGEDALTGSSAAAAAVAEWEDGVYSTDARYSKSKEALRLEADCNTESERAEKTYIYVS